MISKRNWNQEEDNFLCAQANLVQKKNWVEISKKLNQEFKGNYRTPKQCRQRFINHVAIQSSKNFSNQWSRENLKFLLELYEQYGPKWTLIASFMVNKSQNIVKNKFYCSLRKFVRKMNKNLKESNKKYKKEIKYESVVRVLDAFECFTQLPETLKTWSMQIRKRILQFTDLAIRDQQFTDGMLQYLAANINKFNLQTRSYKAKRQSSIDYEESSSIKSSKKISHQIQENTENYNMSAFQGKQNLGQQVKSSERQVEIQSAMSPQQESGEQIKTQLSLNLSQEQIYEDFGVSLSQMKKNSHQPEKGLLEQILPQQQLGHDFEGFY